MKLELEPLEGEKLLPPEEREQMIKRIKPILAEELAHFSDNDCLQIKSFIIQLITYSEIIHHYMEDKEHVREHEDQLMKNHHNRRGVIENASDVVKEYIQLVDISAVEPWLEWEVLIKLFRSELHKRLYEIRDNSGIAEASKNPFLMQVDNVADEQAQDIQQQGRLTSSDIEEYVFQFSIEEITNMIISSRKIITGAFWGGDYYDL
ncbi:MAG: hypothetical protein KZQ83_00635 [gamma proteobacterium symbiont of Taylorina sp.]|nr:hypothetical protein [gamma proteobacterium symbiont of Taylorina sp.]